MFLSPTKRRRLSPLLDGQTSHPPQPSSAELWKWTLTSDAIAPCFIKDVFDMTENTVKDTDFFWLGRVPCRSVRLVGMVVGVQIWEKRVIYSVDDGTSVIDCVHRHTQPPRSATKRAKLKSQSFSKPPEPHELPEPIAGVGSSVRIVGKVTRWHESRRIVVDQIERCTSANDEPNHWRTVRALHKSSYTLPEPFVIPPSTAPLTSQDPDVSNLTLTTEPQTPPSSTTAFATPSTLTASTPAKSPAQQSPLKLRHPSRLRSRDFTANTFRIYLKHYMDNTPNANPNGSERQISNEYENESDTGSTSYSPTTAPLTPTKRSRQARADQDQTPRSYGDRTPRALTSAPAFKSTHLENHSRKCFDTSITEGGDDSTSTMQGFTLSYLRRVPELSDLARRVVKAEAKRRSKEDRKKVKEVGQGQGNAGGSKGELKGKQNIAPKMKRLFGWAIVRLYEEGSIVLWDGPVRPLPEIPDTTSQLWKASSTCTTLGADSTVFSSVSGVTQVGAEVEDEAELSDPQPDEEAYVPLTAPYLGQHVEKAIGTLIARRSEAESRRRRASAAQRLCQDLRAPAAGPTKEEITTFLRQSDERWARVGEWAVDEALEVLRREGRAWCIGRGRWELCI